MANIKSKKKSIRLMEINRVRNMSIRSRMKTLLKAVDDALEAKDEAQVKTAVPAAISSIDDDASSAAAACSLLPWDISSLPDASARYGNRNLKLYKVFVRLDRINDDGAMRPGMTASVDIQCRVVRDALHIPMIALHRRGNHSYVFKATPTGPVPTVLAFGASNLTRVEIVSGQM